MSDSVRDLVEDALPPAETLHTLNVTGEEDGTLFVLAVRTGPYKGTMMIKEVYATVDLDAETVEWSSNGIRRRVNGDVEDFVRSMLRQYSRLQQSINSEEPPEDPLMIDATGADDSEARERLDSPLSPDPVETSQSSLVDPTEEDLSPEERVECHKCGRQIARKNADDFGGFGLGTSVYVCSEGCHE